MANQVSSRAPKNVAQALAAEQSAPEPTDAKIAHIVAAVVAGDAARAISVREEGPSRAQVVLGDAIEASEADETTPEPEAPQSATAGLVQVRNGHVSSVLGITPGEWAFVTPDQAARYSWAWR